MAQDKKEVTYYQFYSNIQNFLSKLKSKPTSAEPSKLLKDNDFGKEKLIRVLIKRNIIKRKESIKDPTNSEEKTAKYYVKYTIIRDKFEDKIKTLYHDYFGKDVLEECDCGGCDGGAMEGGGATNCSFVGGQYTVPFGNMQRRKSYLTTRKKKNKEPKPEEVLGKNISENMNKRRIKLTESQMDYILNKKGINETTTTFSVGAETTRGDMGYDAPAFIDKETAERKPGFSCQTSPIQKKKMKK
jgi:hypothetical protein